MSLSAYLLAIFIPPGYFLLRKRWIAFILQSIFYVIGIICVATIVLAPIGLVIWLLLVLHAVFGLRRDDMNERADIAARKMVAAMRESQLQQP